MILELILMLSDGALTYIDLSLEGKPVFAIIGYVFGIVMPIGRFVLVFEWIIYLTKAPFQKYYFNFKSLCPLGGVDVCIGMILTVFLIIWWVMKEYRNNKKVIIVYLYI